MLPTLVTGVGLLQLFQYVGLREYIGFTALLVGHVVICMPFAVRTVGDQPADAAAQRRARGGEPRRHALAHAAPRRVSADQERRSSPAPCSRSSTRSPTSTCRSSSRGPGEIPITVKILGFLEFGFAPTLAAVSVITLLLPLVLVAIVERVSGLGDFIYGERDVAEPALRLAGIEKHYGATAAVAGIDLEVRRRRVRDAARTFGLRQDHDARPHRRLLPADARARSTSRASRSPTCRRSGATSASCSRTTRCSRT